MIKVILERCAGIDVGKRFVVVCLLTGAASECPRMEKRQYDATVVELEKLSAWLAYLLRHGLIRPSFIPPPEIRELRSLTRQRRDLIAVGARERNRVQRLLEEANIKIGNVLSDVFGVSGQRMLETLVEGKATAAEVAQLAVKSVRRKIPLLEAALEGHG